MTQDNKLKIQIKHRSNMPKSGSNSGDSTNSSSYSGKTSDNKAMEDIKELQKTVRILKKQMGKIISLTAFENDVLEKYKGKNIWLLLVSGDVKTGILHDISKFIIVIKKDEESMFFYKSSIVCYKFPPAS